jgi:hypothetical protein
MREIEKPGERDAEEQARCPAKQPDKGFRWSLKTKR